LGVKRDREGEQITDLHGHSFWRRHLVSSKDCMQMMVMKKKKKSVKKSKFAWNQTKILATLHTYLALYSHSPQLWYPPSLDKASVLKHEPWIQSHTFCCYWWG
jgi:hypothetical protein